MTGPQPAAGGTAPDTAQHEEAARIRADWPGWVVIWVPAKAQFQARPAFSPRWRDIVAAGTTRQELTAAMARLRPRPATAPARANP